MMDKWGQQFLRTCISKTKPILESMLQWNPSKNEIKPDHQIRFYKCCHHIQNEHTKMYWSVNVFGCLMFYFIFVRYFTLVKEAKRRTERKKERVKRVLLSESTSIKMLGQSVSVGVFWLVLFLSLTIQTIFSQIVV